MQQQSMKAALVIFNKMTFLDFVGFYDPMTRVHSMRLMPAFEWRICALDQTVTDDRGGTGVRSPVDSL